MKYRNLFPLLLGLLTLVAYAQPAPTGAAKNATKPKSGFATVNGVKLNYLDWGGKGEVLLLLAGAGNDAHVFDDFAPAFTDRFRVLGITRRGFGESDKPETGYDLQTLVADIRGVLDQLGIKKVNLMGHSFAGDEMTLFATQYPDRTTRLVYLDAALDHASQTEVILTSEDLPPYLRKIMLEGMGRSREAAAVVVKDGPPEEQFKYFLKLTRSTSQFHPDYRSIKVPALAFFMLPAEHFAITPDTDEANRKRMNAWWGQKAMPYIRGQIEKFRREMMHGKVVELNTSDHFIFRGPLKDQVLATSRAFLLSNNLR